MQRGTQLDALANDFAFSERDDGCLYLDVCLRARAHADEFLKDAIVFGAAIGIAGAVFGDGADINGMSAKDLGPAYGDGKKMGVAKRDVGHGDFVGGGSLG